MKIAIVGVCASGKSTLVAGLKAAGYDAINVPQEHSYVHDYWNRRHPDIVVMLEATLPAIHKRREVYWGQELLDDEHKKLADAKAHADLYIQTDHYNAEQVRQIVIDFIKDWQAKKSGQVA